MKKLDLITFITGFLLFSTFAFSQRTKVNGYGHLELNWEYDYNQMDAYMAIGEHDLFVNSNLTDRISFLGEVVVKPTSGGFGASIERAWMKYHFHNVFNVILGKMHTPVNYWNDVYNHARIFFPTIDRPISFSYFVPIHTMGMRFQGQNIGKSKFGYDLVLANGMESTDVYSEGLSPSLTAAFHFKPKEGMRIGGSYHYEHFNDASNVGSHTGHSHQHMPGMSVYQGNLDYHLMSFSLAYFTEKFEFLNESSFNITSTDTLGVANNYSVFLYAGKPISERHVPFVVLDLMKIAENDLHSYPYNRFKMALGYRYEFSPLCNIKLMAEYYTDLEEFGNSAKSKFEFKTQLSYGF